MRYHPLVFLPHGLRTLLALARPVRTRMGALDHARRNLYRYRHFVSSFRLGNDFPLSILTLSASSPNAQFNSPPPISVVSEWSMI
jgi:hypothetical protein